MFSLHLIGGLSFQHFRSCFARFQSHNSTYTFIGVTLCNHVLSYFTMWLYTWQPKTWCYHSSVQRMHLCVARFTAAPAHSHNYCRDEILDLMIWQHQWLKKSWATVAEWIAVIGLYPLVVEMQELLKLNYPYHSVMPWGNESHSIIYWVSE